MFFFFFLLVNIASTKKPSAKQRAKTLSSPNKSRSTQETKHEDSHPIISQEDLPFVEALLVPRTLAWSTLLQWASAVCFSVSLLACINTAGRPYATAVYNILHGTLSSSTPTTFAVPTSIDKLLGKRLADASGDVLPPPHLPNAPPLFGALLSLAIYIAATLFPKWFLRIEIWLNHRVLPLSNENAAAELQKRIKEGTVLAHVQVPRDERHLDGNSYILCPLHISTTKTHGDPTFYFDLHHKRFYYNPEDTRQQVVDGGPMVHASVRLRDLVTTPGLVTKSSLRQAQEQYSPYNALTLPTPTVKAAFIARVSSPLSVMQLVGNLLSALEEDLKSSAMSLATTLLHHYRNARQSIVSAKELAKEVGDTVQNASRETVWALRPSNKKSKKSEWKKLSAVHLLPGDIFVLNNTATIMPVDALLLEGTCVTNEAVLTGESVPQTKTPLQVDANDDTCLDMTGTHRHSVLFAGTSLLHCTNNNQGMKAWTENDAPIPKLPKYFTGARFLALRTGSYSSRGELLRALVTRNSNNVGAISNPQTERDALRLIASLSCFAAMACASLFYGRNEIKTSPFRRVVQCTRIAVASIPSDLPLALSSVAHSCSLRLRQEANVVCSEPGSLLTAAHVQVVVFDKTGTLTADTQALSRIVLPKDGTDVRGMDSVILAGCHSLVDLGDTSTNRHHFVGDPLDLASLQYVGWTYNSAHDTFEKRNPNPKKKNEPVKLWQMKTFPFDANRRTSSALLLVMDGSGRCQLWKTIKGAPDVIARAVHPKHEKWYKKQIRKLGGQGLRVIAMAAIEVSVDDDLTMSLFPNGLPHSASLSDKEFHATIVKARNGVGSLHRIEFEGFEIDGTTEGDTPFQMVGFASFDAAIRPSTRRIIQELKAAQVNVIMLTGDGVDAAISVADAAGLLSCEVSIAVLDVEECSTGDSKLVWKMLSKKTSERKTKGSSFEIEKWLSFGEETVERVLEDAENGRYSLVITGKAAELLLSADSPFNDKGHLQLRKNLYQFTIFAGASPKQKRTVVSNLKDHSGMKVLMCGTSKTVTFMWKSFVVQISFLILACLCWCYRRRG